MSPQQMSRIAFLAALSFLIGSPAFAEPAPADRPAEPVVINKGSEAPAATEAAKPEAAPSEAPAERAEDDPAPAGETTNSDNAGDIGKPDSAPAAKAGTEQKTDENKADAKPETTDAKPEPKEAASEPAKPAPPPGPTLVANINLKTQRMTVSENGKQKYSWSISSGTRDYATPTGTFKPQWMSKMWYSRKYDNAPMPNAVFINGGVAIHGTYHTRMLGSPASHGCIRLAPTNAKTFYDLVGKHGKAMTKVAVFGQPKWRAPAVASRRDRVVTRYSNYRPPRYSYNRPRYVYPGDAYYYEDYYDYRPRRYVPAYQPRRYYQRPRYSRYGYGYYNGYGYGW